ncbi:MAG: YebC/PmpR family DNA-binding transcriptional regulator [Zetaproteobacteria bacterium CG12_big_fil_rev_8_21_14_0_65_54_13]|nr:MAG: YebC/PmpR family DNA-binding transcriptional regulator [Zetaproteobacteria bacterium CG12_big_fil_rev_8_21_14_0_65_54_13]PIX54345.1 MAG: YebC/PmpR family DNA-binding transcriptional regulator [Zetaproteobacteria bacterium CG_4_10_14_3_um_filter_54_28]PJA28549.1 MAG: YebC/PmpR family DNA-binding transcriptional regulator [Zetaproteobacteria bacterium CG_4_9_14_3_um_filter_54_145]
MGRAYQNRKADMAKTAGAKTKVYSRYGREIYVCAKNGGIDPNGNLTLRGLIERAKKDQVPTHVIERAIEKAKGGGGEDYVGARYEGFGPGGCMVIVDCLTDNNNRTYNDVRQCFTKNDGKLGGPGAVAHMFDHQAVFVFKGDDEDAILETLMMADVDVTDIENEDGIITVLAPNTEFFKVKTALNEAIPGIDFEVEEVSYEPQTLTHISGDDAVVFEQFLDALNDCDDVQKVYHNAELDG